MGYSVEIEVPLHPTDSNKILGVNKYAKHAVFKKVKSQMALLLKGKEPSVPLINFKIAVTRHSSKTLDWDNFVASLKPYIDSLTISGVIIDDSYKYLKSVYTNQIISTEKKLVIKVWEAYE